MRERQGGQQRKRKRKRKRKRGGEVVKMSTSHEGLLPLGTRQRCGEFKIGRRVKRGWPEEIKGKRGWDVWDFDS